MRFPDVGGGRSQSQGSSMFISLKDGDKVTGVFRGDPIIFRVHWANGRSVKCPGKAECALCDNEKPKFRFKLNLLVKEDGVWVAKIFEGGYQIYQRLKEMHEGGYNLEQTGIEIKRKGSSTDTEYSVLPLPPNSKSVTPMDIKAIELVPLNELKEQTSQAHADDSGDFGSTPF